MSDENVELVRLAVDAINHRDLATLDAIFSEEAEFHSTFAASEGRVFRGRQGLRDYFVTLGEVFDDMRVEIEEITDAGEDRLVVVLRVIGTRKGQRRERRATQRTGLDLRRQKDRPHRQLHEPNRRLRRRRRALRGPMKR